MNGVATTQVIGLAAGETNISASIGAMTATAKLTVLKESRPAKIKEVKQTKADEVLVTFDDYYNAKDSSEDISGKSFDFAITKANGTQNTNFVKSFTAAKDGKTATIVLNNAFADKDKVVVYLYKNQDYKTSYEFVASVGEVAKVGITKTEYQKDVEEKVEFGLYDANGVDVTSTLSKTDINNRVRLVLSDEPTASLSGDTSEAIIKMTEKGKTATLTINYFKATNTGSTPDFTNAALITCIDPIPVVGVKHIQDKYKNEKGWSDSGVAKVAKFYKGKDIDTISVETGETIHLSFYAAVSDTDKTAISYDGYEVASSNGEKFEASIVDDTAQGKFVNIDVQGITADDDEKLNVTATKNNAKTVYTIPVKIRAAKPDPQSISISVNRSKISNAYDSVYQAGNKLTAKVLDGNGNDISDTTDISWSIKDAKEDDARTYSFSTGGSTYKFKATTKKFALNSYAGKEVTFNAEGLEAGKYKVYAETSNGKKSSTLEINVQSVDTMAYTTVGTKMSYSIEADTSLEVKDKDGASGVARLAAYDKNKVFAGYVGVDGKIGKTNGLTGSEGGMSPSYVTRGVTFVTQAVGNVDTKLDPTEQVYMTIKSGTRFASGTDVGAADVKFYGDDSFKAASFTTSADFATSAIAYAALNTTTPVWYADNKINPNCAKDGATFTVKAKYRLAKNGSASGTNPLKNVWTDAADVTVKTKVSLYAPKVTASTRNISSMSAEEIVKTLSIDVDMNSNASIYQSATDAENKVTGPYNETSKTVTQFDDNKNSQVIGYVAVIEDGVTVYVPLGFSYTVVA